MTDAESTDHFMLRQNDLPTAAQDRPQPQELQADLESWVSSSLPSQQDAEEAFSPWPVQATSHDQIQEPPGPYVTTASFEDARSNDSGNHAAAYGEHSMSDQLIPRPSEFTSAEREHGVSISQFVLPIIVVGVILFTAVMTLLS